MPKLNPTPHLCRLKVKKTALELAQAKFGLKKRRVAMSFLEFVEGATVEIIRRRVSIQAPAGKTLT